MPRLKDQTSAPSSQMQLHFGPQSDLGNESEVVAPVATAPSNVVQVDFVRTNSSKLQKNPASSLKSEKTYLGQVLDRARRLSW